jgi:hypothetical protein
MVLALFAHLFALVEQWVFSCACVCYGLDGKLSFFTHFFSCTHLSHLFYFLIHILFILVPSKISPWKKKTRKLEIHMSFHITHIEVILWAPNSVPNSFYLEFWSKTQFSTSLISFVSILSYFLNVIDQIGVFNFTNNFVFQPK